MKVPECKLCGRAHWASEEHSVSDVTVPEYVREMARGALGGEVPKYAAPFVDHLSPQIKRTEPISGRNKRTEETSATDTAIPPKSEDVVRRGSAAAGVTRLQASSAGADSVSNNRTEMNNRTNNRTRGRPRKWASEAERLRAYRERSK